MWIIHFYQHHLLKRLFSPLCDFGSFVKNHNGYSWVYFWVFYFIPLVYVFCFYTILFLLLKLSSIVWCLVLYLILLFLLRISCAIQILSWFYMNFKIHFSISVKNDIGIFFFW
jgi:hypothetical protein